MSKEITRFCPTIHSGPFHVGHILNYMANTLYAQKHDGNCYFAPEAPYFLGPNRLVSNTFENLKISANFGMIDGRNVCVPFITNGLKSGRQNVINAVSASAQTPFIRFLLERLKIVPETDDKHDSFSNGENFEVAINDFLMGITTLIRGRDLSVDHQKGLHTIFLQSKHEMWLDFLNKKGGKDIKIKKYFHPLISYNHEKISKSNESRYNPYLKNIVVNVHSATHDAKFYTSDTMVLENQEEIARNKAEVADYVNGKSLKFMPSSIALYVIELMTGITFINTADIQVLYKTFDIEQVCSQKDYEYNYETLAATDARLREILCRENNIQTNDPNLIKAERIFMHKLLGFKNSWGVGDYWHCSESDHGVADYWR